MLILCCSHTLSTPSISISIPFDTQQCRCDWMNALIWKQTHFRFCVATEFDGFSSSFSFFFCRCHRRRCRCRRVPLLFHFIVGQTLLKLEFSARVLRTKRKNCVFSTVRTSNGTHKIDGRQSNIEHNTRSFSVSSYFPVELFAHQYNCYGLCGLWVYFNLKFSQQTLWSESVHSSV